MIGKNVWPLMNELDEMSFKGYDYAMSNGVLALPEFKDDLQLMAFEVGISNANIRNNLSIELSVLNSNKRIEGKSQEHFKVLQTVWGQN